MLAAPMSNQKIFLENKFLGFEEFGFQKVDSQIMDDIQTFIAANKSVLRLKQQDNIKHWIEEEGKRQVRTYMERNALSFLETHQCSTKEDYEWLSGAKDRVLRFHKLIENAEQEKYDVVVRALYNDKPIVPPGYLRGIEISHSHLLPFEMTHIWGGGVEAFINYDTL